MEGPTPSTSASHRRPRDSDKPLDIADRLIQNRRRAADAERTHAERQSTSRGQSAKSRERAGPSRTTAATATAAATAAAVADSADNLQRLRISHSNAHLPNRRTRALPPEPDTSMRRPETDVQSEGGSSSYVFVSRGTPSGQLFDPRRDDPLRFSASRQPPTIAKPPPPDEYAASSTSMSSYASSAFTLNSQSTSSSSSSPQDKAQNKDDSNPFVIQLKKIYRDISTRESKILSEDPGDDEDEEPSRVLVHNRPVATSNEDKWLRLISEHKQLAEACHNLLISTLSPLVPASVHSIPTKYNIPTRLWSHAFHRLLEALRRASLRSPVALEHLTDFIYYAYSFYTGLHEERSLDVFKGSWIEALGDLARYRMAVAAHLASSPSATSPSSSIPLRIPAPSPDPTKSDSGSRAPSIGPLAAHALDVEPERETWRTTARDWYSKGLKDTPGMGRLHHHLGLLSRDAEGEELKAVYHFVKSMTTLHSFPTSREAILPLFSNAAQAHRTLGDARTTDLFVLLHGMLFTHIQLDDFQPTLFRFLERLELEGAEEKEWAMMAIINVCAVLEYGKPSGVIRSATSANKDVHVSGVKKREGGAKRPVDSFDINPEDGRMDIDEPEDNLGDHDFEAPSTAIPNANELPVALQLALQLTFKTLAFALRKPLQRAKPFAKPTLNPYIPIILTFLVTVARHEPALKALERVIPWAELAQFLSSAPEWARADADASKLTGGCAPLPEDWCIRGMEWAGRRVYGVGFWKGSRSSNGEMDVLWPERSIDNTQRTATDEDGIIEDEGEDRRQPTEVVETKKRWIRVVRAGFGLARCADGLDWNPKERRWAISSSMRGKVMQWEEEERREREADERRRRRSWSEDGMEVDDVEEDPEEDDEDDDDDEVVRQLKARRRYLQGLVDSERGQQGERRQQTHGYRRPPRRNMRPRLRLLPGYSVLVVDTNILLSALGMIERLVESLAWTVVIPLAVVTELDGLSSKRNDLGEAAQAALNYITSHLRSHGRSLKVQTSRGNYLSTLSVRSENIEFRTTHGDSGSYERNMDDLILRAAVWQDEHWVDRSVLLGGAGAAASPAMEGVSKVVLLTFDRNLRLKARARQLDAADETDMGAIFDSGRVA